MQLRIGGHQQRCTYYWCTSSYLVHTALVHLLISGAPSHTWCTLVHLLIPGAPPYTRCTLVHPLIPGAHWCTSSYLVHTGRRATSPFLVEQPGFCSRLTTRGSYLLHQHQIIFQRHTATRRECTALHTTRDSITNIVVKCSGNLGGKCLPRRNG